MNIQQNISLKKYNTFGINANAKRFIEINSVPELKEILEQEKDVFLIGGGSNMLLTSDIEKLVIHLNLKGIIINDLNNDNVLVTAEAGENWHDFVIWCISQNYGGIENLSLIPGNVGTSPIQNIGAYGVEIKDTFHQLEAIEIATGNKSVFNKDDCNFGYRNSVFKNELKGKYIITNVTFKLTKKNHKTNISYGAIKEVLKNIKKPTLKDISDAIIAIRQSKLPDPEEIGNSGSFFKNPVIDIDLFKKIQKKYSNIPNYVISSTEIKVPAGWLIEQCGFKGKRFGETGVHEKQALVLVNYGNATGKEVFKLAKKIQQTVLEKFAIPLEIEVNVI
ncbi:MULTISPECIES: UDP-N-acetylmuramate dehydrogenase [Flavobacteriaceae]|uniref:UDP-N-acetylenolpyruvoylglucosamine reductase n=2 Tax=Flavobacteriaceae TaxID=49546 RepID=A0A4Y8AWL5_9FLAO|nr:MULTISPECIES: UDP-N-acetylmuramate dehydrogenase [Flavobacteriaceae]TEW76910.1 UDP-N-acetylmuramate dehydrogenase [Gramella jeungdoensis]GGK59382.1 UDP-N-acetylenolpyruvoylglucosamine reductase [Lutibacter litoralis]